MTRTATVPALRRRLALSTALGMTLCVLAGRATAQVQGSFGDVGSTAADGFNLPSQQPTFQVTPQTPTAGERLDVDLNARNTVIDWVSFNVPAGPSAAQVKTVSFNNALSSGSAGKAVLNRVTGATATEISGIVTTGTRNADLSVTQGAGNIQVWIVNGNGILVGAGANFNTGGLVLSALGMDANNADAFRNTASGGAYNVQFTSPAASSAAIASAAGAPALINTNNGVLALIAPRIDTNINFNSGSGATAFAIATDVSLSTTPGGPLSVTLNAGTQLPSSTIGGAVVGDRVYALIKPQDTFDTLLSVTAPVTNATVNAAGVVVLSGGGLTAAVGTDVLGTGGANMAGDVADAVVSSVAFATPVGAGPTPPSAGTVRLEATGAVTVSGAVSSGAAYAVTGTTVALGAGAVAAAQTAAGAVTLTATAGAVTIASGVTLTADGDGSGDLLTVGGAATTALTATGATLRAGGAGTGEFRLRTATNTTGVDLGNVVAGTLSQTIAAGAVTAGIDRSGNVAAGSLMLSGTNSVTTTGTLAVTGAVATGDGLTLRGNAGVTIGGTIANIGAATGNVTVTAVGAGAAVSVQGSTLAGALTLAGGTGGISFTALGAAGDKIIETAGAVGGTSIDGGRASLRTVGASPISITGAVGALIPLTSLRIDGGTGVTIGTVGSGTTALASGTLIVGSNAAPGAFTVNGATSVNTVDIRMFGGSLSFGGAVAGNGSGAFTVNTNGDTTLGGPITGYTSFSSVGAGAVRLNGGAVSTSGAQTYGQQLILGANTVLTGTGATFTGGIAGSGNDLALNFSTAQTLTGAALTGVRNLATDTVGAPAGGTTLVGTIATSGTQTYNDAVTLSGPTVTVQSSGTGTGGNITFAGPLDGASALVATTAGTLTFGGTVGATPLTSIAATGAGAVQIQGASVTTTGSQAYSATTLNGTSAGTVTLNAGAGNVGFTALNGPRGLIANATGTTALPGGGSALASVQTNAGGTTSVSGVLTTVGAQIFGDPVSLTGATTLSGSSASFNAGLTGNGNDLTINSSGAQLLDGTITGVRDLTTDAAGTLTLNGAITTTGSQSYGEAVTLASAVTLTAGATSVITFNGTVDGVQSLSTSAQVTNFNADVGGTAPLTSLAVTGATSMGGAATRTVTTTGQQSYGGALSLNRDAVLIGSGATFGGDVNGSAAARSLTLRFSGANALAANPFVNVGDLRIDGAGTTTLNGAVATERSQTYVSPVALAAPVVLTSNGAGAVSLGAVTGAQTLIVNTGGVTTFNTTLAGLTSLTTDAPGSTILNAGVSTSGAQTYGDAVTLGGNLTLASTAAGSIRFGGTVNGASSLSVNTAGLTTFDGAVGGGTALGSLASTGSGAVVANGGAIRTTGGQSFTGQLRLGADTVLTGATGVFASGVLGNGNDLTLNYSGTSSVGGNFIGIDNLVTGAGGRTELSGVIETAGGQSYGDAVTLTAATTLRSGAAGAGPGAITMASTLDGAQALSVSTGGAAQFTGPIGAGVPLASVTVNAASITAGQTNAATTLSLTSAGNITLAGAQAGGNATFDAGGAVTLGQVLAGPASTISVRGLDVTITGIQRANTVTFTNRAPATTAVKLGTGTSTGGFALSSDEVNLVEAGQLTIDAGSGNVELGTLAFDADAGRTRVDVLTTGRLDVTGAVSGAGAGRTFRLGGSTNPAAKASVIRVTATPSAGGRLLFADADLDLRGARIGVGQAAGFLDPIGFGTATGQSGAQVSDTFISNPNSSLYDATFGGVAYTAPALVTARSLTVRYTDYALFQNTGVPGISSGVTLGSAGGPQPGTLVVQGPGNANNGFAYFGTIGGIEGNAAAVLGATVTPVSNTDPANTRINGCLVGSGAGCLTAVVSQPLLAIFDSSRAKVFGAGDDLAVPFDPVVGTNNEALFSGVGLIDGSLIDVECTPESTDPGCVQAKEQPK
ncbi:filamentous hemagglutinin N-terminal domain-containing protein [Sphingomonas sp.]|jgi:filamentous hemagglutinin family protein|uniref:beta strand repeat-containing protein n=1 Tax=Sphingomonas sp. TaxID=28214 RepID=UPI002D7E8078|nr:filamentous hemagglutinin N-terminal domain-containing protein [Sphingomonas sp.]HEU0044802.1 filamentous hemagglutinin N-terminal domain-containing protein [Sphingomonas sp.]